MIFLLDSVRTNIAMVVVVVGGGDGNFLKHFVCQPHHIWAIEFSRFYQTTAKFEKWLRFFSFSSKSILKYRFEIEFCNVFLRNVI